MTKKTIGWHSRTVWRPRGSPCVKRVMDRNDPESPIVRQPPRILVVDDEEDNVLWVSDRLSAQGYEILTAGDGEEALRLAIEQQPDLILLDIMMPGLDGLEVCRRLRSRAALPFIPIIFLSALAQSRDVVAGLDAGGDEYLTKPIDPEQLVARVRSMLRMKALQDDLAEMNRTLDERVRQQVEELERMGRLRRYFSPQVADLILSSGGEDSLKPDRRVITVVFCDLRGFTAFSNRAPEELIDVLREYHAAMGELIFRYEGTLEQFAGDGLMVFFNAPFECENPRERAVRMAMEMRDRMVGLTARWNYELEAALGFGVGIDHGYASIGRIGFEGRFDYAVIGPHSNRAARLCAAAKDRQILVTQRVYGGVEQFVNVEPLDDMELKGVAGRTQVYNVLGLKDAASPDT